MYDVSSFFFGQVFAVFILKTFGIGERWGCFYSVRSCNEGNRGGGGVVSAVRCTGY